jgi:RHS repeat-associated protein
VIQERDGLNLPAVIYTRGLDLSGTFEGAGGIGGLLAISDLKSSISSPSHFYYHADGNGNVTMLVNAQQVVIARYLYDPFGNALGASGPSVNANLYRFSSKETHQNSGLVYYLYRYYDPGLERWLNRDPLTDDGFTMHHALRAFLPHTPIAELVEGSSLYEFVGQNPICRYDPYGLAEGFPFVRNCTTTELKSCAEGCGSKPVESCKVWEWYDKDGNLTSSTKICICQEPVNRCHRWR